MVKGLEKIIKHFIDNKEYSPGLIIKIVNVELDIYDNIKIIFDLDNVDDVPYNIIIVGLNLKKEIEKYSEYISFEPNEIIVSYVKQPISVDVFYAYGSMPFKDVVHLTNSFKSSLLNNLQNINKLPLNYYDGKKEYIELLGKFIPRIYFSEFKNEILLNLTFRVIDTNPSHKFNPDDLVGDVDEAFINNEFEEYGQIQNALTLTFDEWYRNFYLDDSSDNLPYWMTESFRIFINLV